MKRLFPPRVVCCLPIYLNRFRLGYITFPCLYADASNLNQFAIDHGEICLSPVLPEITMVEKIPPLFCVPINGLLQRATSPYD